MALDWTFMNHGVSVPDPSHLPSGPIALYFGSGLDFTPLLLAARDHLPGLEFANTALVGGRPGATLVMVDCCEAVLGLLERAVENEEVLSLSMPLWWRYRELLENDNPTPHPEIHYEDLWGEAEGQVFSVTKHPVPTSVDFEALRHGFEQSHSRQRPTFFFTIRGAIYHHTGSSAGTPEGTLDFTAHYFPFDYFSFVSHLLGHLPVELAAAIIVKQISFGGRKRHDVEAVYSPAFAERIRQAGMDLPERVYSDWEFAWQGYGSGVPLPVTWGFDYSPVRAYSRNR